MFYSRQSRFLQVFLDYFEYSIADIGGQANALMPSDLLESLAFLGTECHANVLALVKRVRFLILAAFRCHESLYTGM